jgi:hypothetical protein
MTITSLETANNPTASAAAAQKASAATKTGGLGFDFADMLNRVRIDSEAQLSILKTDRTSQPVPEAEPRRDDPVNNASDAGSDDEEAVSEKPKAEDKQNASNGNEQNAQQQANGQQKTATPLYAINAAETQQTAASTTNNTNAAATQQNVTAAAATNNQAAQSAQVVNNTATAPDAAAQAAAAQSQNKGQQKTAANANSNTDANAAVKAAQSGNVQQQSQDIASRLQPGEKVQVNVRNDGPVDGTVRTPLLAENTGDAKLLPTDMRGMAGQVKPEGQNGPSATQQAAQAAAANPQQTAGQPKSFDAALMGQMSRFEAPQPSAASNATAQTTGNPMGKIDGMPAPSGAPTGLHNLNQTANTAPAQAANAKRATPQAQQVMQQVSVQVSKAVSQGLDRIQIQLKPADLGRVDIQMEVTHDGRINAVVQADKPETLDMLRQDSRQLEQALKDAGLKADGGSLQFSLRGEGGSGDGNGQQTASSGGNANGGDAGEGLDKNEAGHPEHQDIVSNDQIDVVV